MPQISALERREDFKKIANFLQKIAHFSVDVGQLTLKTDQIVVFLIEIYGKNIFLVEGMLEIPLFRGKP